MHLVSRYQAKYGKDLREVLKKELGGSYEDAVLTWASAKDPAGGYEADASAPALQQVNALIAANWGIRNHVAAVDFSVLQKAGKGLGTNERDVIQVICHRTKDQLDLVDDLFRAKGSSLKQFIVDELDGNLEDFLEYTQMEEDEFDAIMLYEAFKGLGCDEKAVVEVLTTRSFKRLHNAKVYYEARNDHSLIDALRDELSGTLEYLACRLVAGAKGIAEKKGHNLDCSPEEMADRLYAGGSGKFFGTDENMFVEFLTDNTLAEVQAVAAAYEMKHGRSLESSIRSEFSGITEKALVNMLRDPIDNFAVYIKV